jgi:hypothetical protein
MASPEPGSPEAPLAQAGRLVFPYESADAGNAIVLAGTTIGISWLEGPPGAAQYDFFYTPDGSSIPVLIGSDSDPTDGVSVEWFVPEHLAGTLSGEAHFADAADIASLPSMTIFSRAALPEDVCTIRSTSIGVVEVFREPSPGSEAFAYIPPGKFLPALEMTSDGWFRIDAGGAYDLVSGETASGTGWVRDQAPVGTSGPCEDLPLLQ